MTTTVPDQYAFLIRFLRECSGAYTEEIGKLARSNQAPWNPDTARFEVDAYFTFLLSSSLLHLKHERQVWEDMCNLCEAALTHAHQESVDSDDLSDVFIARIEEYGRIANRASKAGDSPQMDWIKSLRQHIMASAHDSRVEAEHPIMIGGFFKEFTLVFEYLRIDLFFAGAFACGLKHIFQSTSDVRSVTEEELTRLAQAGQKEAAQIAARTLESMTNDSKSESSSDKRWWQFWR